MAARGKAATGEASATERTYQRAVELMRGGMSGKAAFERIAEETGESAGTVQARYYRVARKAGEVKRRPRSKPAPAAKAAAPATRGRRGSRRAGAASSSADSLAGKLEQAARLLQEAAVEARALEADAQRWRQVRPLLDQR
jgi:hypothetical protein